MSMPLGLTFYFHSFIILLHVHLCPHSLMAKRSNGNAEIQVRFSLGAPFNITPTGVFLFFFF